MGDLLEVGVVGGTGYTGVELLRLLAMHPRVRVGSITSRAEKGMRVDALFPSLRGHYDLVFEAPEDAALRACDVVFFATPHGVAMNSARELLDAGVRVVDLSADFRIRDVAVWEQWYAHQHAAPEVVAEAVYGLPEVNRTRIADARIVAVPGCYPTAVQLGFIPLLEAGLVDAGHLVASAASGVSGAGRQAKVDNLLSEVHDSFKAYGVAGHRHLPEIEQGLRQCSKTPVALTFVPHLAPMIRGIHATLFARLRQESTDIRGLFARRYRDEPFVDVLPAGDHPQTRSVRGSNLCRIAIEQPQGRDVVVVLAVIDNLVKGAAGQAVQNMNIMFDLPETLGLQAPPLSP
jgi:N-acetyl-gamma-glutamyl-phosphate reductase